MSDGFVHGEISTVKFWAAFHLVGRAGILGGIRQKREKEESWVLKNQSWVLKNQPWVLKNTPRTFELKIRPKLTRTEAICQTRRKKGGVRPLYAGRTS